MNGAEPGDREPRMASRQSVLTVTDVPHRDDRHGPPHRAILRALAPLDGLRLLDVGCGVGLLLRSAERRGALVAGVDTAAERLEIARWAVPDADLREAGSGALPFGDDSFDVVVAAGGAADLAELVRVARPGGRVAVGRWVHPAGCWARTLGERLRRLTGGAVAPDTGPGAGPGAGLRSAGLGVVVSGEVGCPAKYPSLAATWAALLGGEDLVRAIGVAGERAVHDAFLAAVEPAIGAGGTIALVTVFRYAVAEVPG